MLQGVSLGAKGKGDRAEQALREAITGVDEALAKSAEASKLAIEEAAGRIKEFGSQDLKHGLNDLRALEGMFLDTVKNIAQASDGTARELLNDMEQHARNTGTAVGTTAKTAVERLSGKLEKDVRESVTADTDTALKVGKQLSQAAAGFLEGIAETLKKTSSTEKEK